jgi:hypothetical protein
MSLAKIPRVRSFVKRTLKLPLFENVGQPIDDKRIVGVRSFEDAFALMEHRTWQTVCTRVGNYTRAQQIVAFGEDWYQRDYNDDIIRIGIEIKPIYKVIDSFWRKNRLPINPCESNWFRPKMVVRWFFLQLAIENAFESAVTQPFGANYLEPVLFAGHLPCGWKGRLPSEGIKRSDVGFSITKKLASKTIQEAYGDGRIVAY